MRPLEKSICRDYWLGKGRFSKTAIKKGRSLPLTSYSYFTRRLGELWEEAGGEEEPLTEREIEEIKGDERYHAMADGERI